MNINRVKWFIEALESGEFAQTTGSLHDEHGYCCLGLACELYSQKVGGFWELATQSSTPFFISDFASDGLVVHGFVMGAEWPEAVAKWFEIPMHTTRQFINFNDDQRAPFVAIAAWLRRRVNEQQKKQQVNWHYPLSQ